MTLSKTKQKKCQLTSTFSSKMSPQCHMPSRTCHFNFQSVNWRVVFFFTCHNTCQNLNYARQSTCSLFLCKFLHVKRQKLAKTLSKIHTGQFSPFFCMRSYLQSPTMYMYSNPKSFGPSNLVGPLLAEVDLQFNFELPHLGLTKWQCSCWSWSFVPCHVPTYKEGALESLG